MSILRRLAYPLRLAGARLARRTGRVALVAVGVAAGGAMLAGSLGGSLLAQDRSLDRAVQRIPAQDRAVRANWAGVPFPRQDRFDRLDRAARDALRPLAARPPFAASSARSDSRTARVRSTSAAAIRPGTGSPRASSHARSSRGDPSHSRSCSRSTVFTNC